MELKIESLPSENAVSVVSRQVYSYPAHIHTYSELILYERFDGEITVNDLKIEASDRCAVLIVPGDLHRVEVRCGDARFIKVCLAGFRPASSAVQESLKEDDILVRLLEELLREGEEGCRRLLAETALRMVCLRGKSVPHLRDNPASQVAMEALDILCSRYGEELSLNSVSKALFVSPQYLSKVFRQTVGVGFSEYLTGLRLNKAAELLRSTAKSVAEICLECGYNNLSHFIRRFKACYGCPPSVYRITKEC